MPHILKQTNKKTPPHNTVKLRFDELLVSALEIGISEDSYFKML